MSAADSLPANIRRQVNRRLTLNCLIQGAATHAFLSSHHLVASELSKLDGHLVACYDQLMPRVHLGYFAGGIPLVTGNPKKFWRRINRPSHPFCFHPFLRKHGPSLFEKARNRVFERCEAKEIPTKGLAKELDMVKVYSTLLELEKPHLDALERLGKQVCHEIYGIDTDLLDAEITPSPAWGSVRQPQTWRGRIALRMMVGWGGVSRHRGSYRVTAKATVWPLLVHELIKGTVELISLHGLSDLEDAEFKSVMDQTEHLEYEFPMIQIGGEFFKMFLAVLPRGLQLAECIMHVARFSAQQLDDFLMQMVESPNRATDALRFAADRFDE